MTLSEMAEFCQPPCDLEGMANAIEWMQYLNDIWGHMMIEIYRKAHKNEPLSYDESVAIGRLRDAYVTVKNALREGVRDSK